MRNFSIIAFSLLLCLELSAQVSITGPSGSYNQDFNTLINTGSGTWTDNSTVIHWYAQRSGTGTTIAANNGSGTGGNLYSYGTGTDSDRALGSIGSGNAAAGDFAYGVLLQNNTGQVLNDLTIEYVGEQWRNGGTANLQTVSFFYKISNAPITALEPDNNGTWTAENGLDWTSPTASITAAPLDGNANANKDTILFTLTGLNLANGDYIMLKWDDPDHPGTDHGLSIDDVVISWNLGGGSGTTDLVITEINYQSPIPLPPDILEFIEITNIGVAPIDLTNYVLSGDIDYTFNGTIIEPGSQLLIAKSASDLSNLGLTALQWNSGDLNDVLGTVVLKDDQGLLVDSVRYTNAGPWPGGNANGLGASIELCDVNNDNNDGTNWQASVIFFDEILIPQPVSLRGTPGSANICSPYSGPAPQIVINEIRYEDPAGADSLEYVELYNYGSAPVDLGGFYFTTGFKFTFPATNLPAGGYLLIAKDSASLNQYLGLPSQQWRTGDLDNVQDTLKLYLPDGTLLDSVLYEAVSPWPGTGSGSASIELCRSDADNANGAHWAATTDSLTQYAGNTIFGTPLSGTSCNLFQPITDLVITEINYNDYGNPNDTLEFIEIFNNGNNPIDLFGVVLSGDINYTFGADTLLPGQFIVISIDSLAIQQAFGVASYTWTSGTLSNTAGDIVLTDGLGNLVDSVHYENTYPWKQLADGHGFSLVLCDPNADNNQAQNWDIANSPVVVNGNGDLYWAHPGSGCTIISSDLVITEFMYNDPSLADSLEFIEIYNNGSQTINLAGYGLVGVDYTFPAISVAPSNYVLVAADSAAFQGFYGIAPFQWTSGDLSDSGEGIALLDDQQRVIDHINYTNSLPWNPLANGLGYSLVLCNPNQDNLDFSNWALPDSVDSIGVVNGIMVFAHPDTTCSAPSVAPGTLIITEIMYNSPEGPNDINEFIEIYNPSNTALDLTDYTLSFGTGFTFTIPSGTVPPQGFAVFAKDAAAIQANYTNLPTGTLVIDWGTEELHNNGIAIVIRDDNNVVKDSVVYSDQAPWPVTIGGIGPDGGGYSIVFCGDILNLDNNDGNNWIAAQSEVPGFIVAAKQVFANPGDTCYVTLIPSDQTAPLATAANTVSCTQVKVTFNEVVTTATAENLANYSIVPAGVSIINAALDVTQTEVTLITTALTSGTTYTLSVSNVEDLAGNAMTATASFPVNCQPLGIDNENPLFVKLYPVPAQNYLQVETAGNFEAYIITDLAGRNIMADNISEEVFSLDISTLRSGIYMISFSGTNGINTQRFIKE